MKEFFKAIVKQFVIITTCIILVLLIVLPLMGVEGVSIEFLWQLMLSSLLCSLSVIIFYSKKELTRKQYIIRRIIHFFLLEGIVVTESAIFDWFGSSKFSLTLPLIVLAIFVIANVIMIITETFKTKDVNDTLKRYNSDDQEQ